MPRMVSAQRRHRRLCWEGIGSLVNLKPHQRGVILPVKARAGARRNAVTGQHDGMLQVSVTQAPEKGKANTAISKLLAKSLGVRAAEVELLAGATSPRKQFLIANAEIEELRVAIDERLSAGP